MQIKYEICAIVGTFKNQNGEEKAKFKNVGTIMVKDDGKEFMLLDKTFNPAGLAEPNRENIILSLFTPKTKEEKEANKHANSKFAKSAQHYEAKQNGYQPYAIDDEIPF